MSLPTPILTYSLSEATVKGLLPDGYTPLAYIESTGTQYINTEIIPTNKIISTEAKFQLTNEGTAAPSLIGSGVNDGTDNCRLFGVYQSKWRIKLSGTNWQSSNNIDTHIHIIRINFSNGSFLDNNKILNNQVTISSTNNKSLYIFNDNNGGGTKFCGKVYYLTLYDNNNLIGDYRPARRDSDGAIGMYDLVSKTFKTNSGTGTFIAGPPLAVGKGGGMSLPEEYLLVEYLESAGTLYIDTGTSLSQGDTFKFEWEDVFVSGTKITGSLENKGYGLGDATGSNPNISGGGRISGNYIHIWVNGADRYTSHLNKNNSTSRYLDTITCTSSSINVHMKDIKTGTVYIDNTINTTSYASGNMFLFRDSSGEYPYIGVKRVYKCSITGTHNKIFIPCYRKSDMKPGMYDTVNGVFYTNAGSGEFILGPSVTNVYTWEPNAGSGTQQGLYTNVSGAYDSSKGWSADFTNSGTILTADSPSTSVRSVSFWMKPDLLRAGNLDIIFVDYKSNLAFGKRTTGSWSTCCRVSASPFSTSISDGNWYHVVIVNTGDSASSTNRVLYINGNPCTQVSSEVGSWAFSKNRLEIGMRSSTMTSDNFRGQIRNFCMYDVALTAEQVKELYGQ